MVINKKRKQAQAKLLYLRTELSQKEIAEQVGVTEATLSKWVNANEEEWKLEKASFIITKDQELRRIYQQISALNDAIQMREVGSKYPTSSEADILSKLSKAAHSLERESSVSEVINVSIGLTEYLQEYDPEKAKEWSALLDGYIKHKMSRQ